jgi:23S rRNA-/tRNA-specific pseudouridylate synthase
MEFPSGEPAEPKVVYEDEWLLAVSKPERMHCAPGLGPGDLCAWAFERYPEIEEVAASPGMGGRGEAGGPRIEICRRLGSEKAGGPRSEGGLLHRLDYETSGLVLFARKAEAFASLLDQQKRGTFFKEYVALSAPSRAALPLGSLPPEGTPCGVAQELWTEARNSLDPAALSGLLGEAISRGSCRIASAFRSYGPKGARVACLEPDGAEGGYRSEILACSPFSSTGREENRGELELRLSLARGFRHQIRAQLAWIGLPILGDPLYGGAADARLRLYAVRLAFSHPVSGNALSIESES